MDTKYLIDGDAVNVIATTDKGILVSRLYEAHDEYGSIELGVPFLVNKIFDAAPTGVYEQKIKDLQTEIDQKIEHLKGLNAIFVSYEKQIRDFERNRSKYPDLSCVIDIAAGKEMWVVFEDSLKVKKYPDDCRDYGKELRSICWASVWDEKRNRVKMELYMGQYRDLSGSRYAISLFKTEEEAQEFLKEKILKNIRIHQVATSPHDSALEAATRINFVCDEVLAAQTLSEQYRRAQKVNRIASLNDEINKIRADLEAQPQQKD